MNGRNTISWEEKLEFDVKYIQKISLFRDIIIILKTILKVLKHSDIVREGTVSDMDLGDWLLQEAAITQEEYEERQKSAKVLLR